MLDEKVVSRRERDYKTQGGDKIVDRKRVMDRGINRRDTEIECLASRNGRSKRFNDRGYDSDNLEVERAAFKNLEEDPNNVISKAQFSHKEMEERIQKLASQIAYIHCCSDALGKLKRPVEALNVFPVMQQQMFSYPDLVAYHSIAVTLGQAGHMKQLFVVIDIMRSPPKKKFKKGIFENWDPRLEPDIVVYNNAVLMTHNLPVNVFLNELSYPKIHRRLVVSLNG